MKRNLTLILIFTAFLFTASSAIANDKEGPLTGTWNCQTKGGSEGSMPFTLYLHQNDATVEGSVSSPLGDTQITSGTFKGGTLEIHIYSPDADYVLIAKLDNGTLSGTWSKDSDDQGPWEGKKQAAGSQ